MTDSYGKAHDDVVFLPRPTRVLLQVEGAAPARMLNGLFTGSMPPDLEVRGDDVWLGRAPCSVILTPKGRMVSDVRVSRLENGEGGALLIDLPVTGLAAVLDHLSKYLPPRFARIAEPNEPLGMLTLIGRQAPQILARFVAPGADEPTFLELGEGGELVLGGVPPSGDPPLPIRIVRAGDVAPPAFDVIGPSDSLREMGNLMRVSGTLEVDQELWEVLRIERGRPRFGVEMDDTTMPAEAGLEGRCIDDRKGCYTGQEVVVRIRDRGHVNRHLRGLLLGDSPQAKKGDSLYEPDGGRPVGTLLSAVHSPRFEQVVGLGYLRREIEPPSEVALGTSEGAMVGVRALSPDGWRLVEGDPSFNP